VDAFREVSAAYKERERLKNEADAFRRERLIRAAGATAWLELSHHGDLTEERWARLRETLTGEAFGELSAAEAFAIESVTLAAGEAESFLKQRAAHAAQPRLTQWRLFMDTLAVALADRPKLLLDRAGSGKRHLLLGVPASVPGLPSALPALPPQEE
jgi:membrane protease subunit HflK